MRTDYQISSVSSVDVNPSNVSVLTGSSYYSAREGHSQASDMYSFELLGSRSGSAQLAGISGGDPWGSAELCSCGR